MEEAEAARRDAEQRAEVSEAAARERVVSVEKLVARKDEKIKELTAKLAQLSSSSSKDATSKETSEASTALERTPATAEPDTSEGTMF